MIANRTETSVLHSVMTICHSTATPQALSLSWCGCFGRRVTPKRSTLVSAWYSGG
jgi:hypothetical protein